MPNYGHDYVLLWAVEIFREEAREVARTFNAVELERAGTHLLEEAMTGPQPLRDMQTLLPKSAWTDNHYDSIKAFLNQLADDADLLPKERRRYWIQRHTTQASPEDLTLSFPDLRREWLQVVTKMGLS